MCFVWLSEITVHFALYIIKRLVFITEVKSVYCAVRTDSLYKPDTFRLERVKIVECSPFGVSLSALERPQFVLFCSVTKVNLNYI